jgi:hydrogenase-4 component E
MMNRALRDVKIKREVEPLIGLHPPLSSGARHGFPALLLRQPAAAAEQHAGALLVPTAIATVLAGFILLTTRSRRHTSDG